ncbi:calcium-activated chloride channel regulator 4-like isoform X2 [Daphnia pulicaria]|nr:calcium-activated chloride channel regulator 4-like isoform X2 [Daphnia pulicaria]
MHKDVPYTQQNGKCGEKGERIHLTPNYVLTIVQEQNIAQYGKPGKVFVHEWAHYRYGIFDEYGTPGGEYPLFFRQSGTSFIEPNICANKKIMYNTRDISNNNANCQIDPATNIYDQNCRFEFHPSFKPDTSLASFHLLDSVVHFCKDGDFHSHRSETPNKHNTMCGGVSTWTVIMRNPDFAFYQNRPVDLDQLPAKFKIVKPTGSRFVVVMDVSDSMKQCNRIDKLGESVRAWIKNDVPTGSQLGMVMFSSTAHIVSELKVISDMKIRQEMMKKVPKDLYSITCIGCGLDLAVQMLQEKGNNKTGGIIVLVTDGRNSAGYLDISDVEEDIVKAGIRVVTVAFGSEADSNIERLADVTGGKSYYIKDGDSSEAIQQAFTGACTYQSRVKNDDLKFKLFESTAASNSTSIEGCFDVDDTVGRNLVLSVFNLDDRNSLESMQLSGPTNEIYDQIDFDTSTATVTVALAKVGRWDLNVTLKSSQSKPVLVTVKTQLRPNVTTPINTRCWVSNGADIKDASNHRIRIHADVWKGSHPVTGASVKAYIVKPNDELEILDLLDNGVNADTTQDDGVYSKYFAYPNQPGRYTVKCQVNSTNHKAFEQLGFIGSASPQLFGNETIIGEVERIPMANFTRIVSGGSFQVEIPVNSNDSYPPAEVTDLSIMVVNDTATNISIALKWTAPGDDLDSGTASYYELKYSDVVADVINSNFDDKSPKRKSRSIITEEDLVAGSLQPSEAGVQQTATFQLTDVQRERPYYLSLRAVDKADKAGQVSNLVVFFIPDRTVVVLTKNFEDDDSGNGTDQEIHIHINTKEPSYHVASLLVAAFGLILIVCLVVMLLVAVVKYLLVYRSYKDVPV